MFRFYRRYSLWLSKLINSITNYWFSRKDLRWASSNGALFYDVFNSLCGGHGDVSVSPWLPLQKSQSPSNSRLLGSACLCRVVRHLSRLCSSLQNLHKKSVSIKYYNTSQIKLPYKYGSFTTYTVILLRIRIKIRIVILKAVDLFI